MPIVNPAIQTQLDAYKAALVAPGVKATLLADIRDYVDAVVQANLAGASLEYNANGLFIRKAYVACFATQLVAPFTALTFNAAFTNEAVSTLSDIRTALAALLTPR